MSYARGDDLAQVRRFFDDLSAELRVHAGLPADAEVGYLDVRMPLGTQWSPGLMDALSRCRVFLGLLSPGFLASDSCGKEWAVFLDRQSRYAGTAPDVSSTLLPLWWLPSKRLPVEIAALQHDTSHLPEPYKTAGIRQLLRLQKYHDAYLEVLSELAVQILDAADHVLPAAQESHFVDVQSAFAAFNAGASGAARSRRWHAHRAHVMVVAPANGEFKGTLGEQRSDRRYYGRSARDWAPYQPSSGARIADFAREIAHGRGFEAEVEDGNQLRLHMTSALQRKQLFIVLVDPWAAHHARHRRALQMCAELDRDDDGAVTTIFVPVSHDDAETRSNWRTLSRLLNDVLPDRFNRDHVSRFRANIPTTQTFEAYLCVVLEEYRNRVFSKTTLVRPIEGDQGPRPVLGGP